MSKKLKQSDGDVHYELGRGRVVKVHQIPPTPRHATREEQEALGDMEKFRELVYRRLYPAR